MEHRGYHVSGFAASLRFDALFVHDFVRIDLPFDAVVGAFSHFVTPALLGELVVDAWRTESAELGRVMGAAPTDELRPTLEVRIGSPRSRRDALVIPISWSSFLGSWIPPLEADLELVAFGPDRAHLHVLGQSHLPLDAAPCTDRASVEHRLTVALVRHVLSALAVAIVGDSKRGGEA